MKKLSKLKRGDKVAILSPSFAAPGKWPHVYELGLKRLREVFGLEPIEFPATKRIGATREERSRDLMDAFADRDVKAVISTLGGDDQVTYVKNLPSEIFATNPKPFFGFSDNTHFLNFLWLCGVPSYYGGTLFTQFAEPGGMNEFTIKYLEFALFGEDEVEIEASRQYSDIGLDWGDPGNLSRKRIYEANAGWTWDGSENAEGITWGGCLESIDELLRHGVPIPTLSEFEQVVLLVETSEEIPDTSYVFHVLRAMGERGILERVSAVMVGRPQAWEFHRQNSKEEKEKYRAAQREVILETVRKYNQSVPIVQNLDFGHTEPQIPIPYGQHALFDSKKRKISMAF